MTKQWHILYDFPTCDPNLPEPSYCKKHWFQYIGRIFSSAILVGISHIQPNEVEWVRISKCCCWPYPKYIPFGVISPFYDFIRLGFRSSLWTIGCPPANAAYGAENFPQSRQSLSNDPWGAHHETKYSDIYLSISAFIQPSSFADLCVHSLRFCYIWLLTFHFSHSNFTKHPQQKTQTQLQLTRNHPSWFIQLPSIQPSFPPSVDWLANSTAHPTPKKSSFPWHCHTSIFSGLTPHLKVHPSWF